MPHPFLAAARQGSYRRQHYALSLLLILALLWSSIVTIAMLLTLGLTLWQGAIADNITVQQWQADHPQLFMGMALGVLLLLSFGIALAVQAIHRRPWRNPAAGAGSGAVATGWSELRPLAGVVWAKYWSVGPGGGRSLPVPIVSLG
jgi:hypothetical protein